MRVLDPLLLKTQKIVYCDFCHFDFNWEKMEGKEFGVNFKKSTGGGSKVTKKSKTSQFIEGIDRIPEKSGLIWTEVFELPVISRSDWYEKTIYFHFSIYPFIVSPPLKTRFFRFLIISSHADGFSFTKFDIAVRGPVPTIRCAVSSNTRPCLSVI